jgi:hypothetical protein
MQHTPQPQKADQESVREKSSIAAMTKLKKRRMLRVVFCPPERTKGRGAIEFDIGIIPSFSAAS